MTNFTRSKRIAYTTGLTAFLLLLLLGLAVRPSHADPVPGNSSITIVKEANPQSEQEFGFASAGLGSPFTLKDNGTDPNSRTFSNLPATSYNVTELTIPAGWVSTGVQCTSSSSTSSFNYINKGEVEITLAADDEVTCTFSNALAGSVTIVKQADPADGTDFDFELTGDATDSFTLNDTDAADDNVDSDNSQTFLLDPGNSVDYKFTETIPAGWEVDNIFCTAKPGDDVTTRADIDAGELTIAELSPGAEVSCTFVNKVQQASVTIVKQADPADGTDFDFELTGDATGGFTLDDANPDDNDGITNSETFNLDAGTLVDYKFTETIPAGWEVDNIFCTATTGDATTGANFDLGELFITEITPGAEVTCTFVNVVPKASVTIVKQADPADGTDFDFELTGDATDSFTLDDANPDDNDGITNSETFLLDPGNPVNYKFTETIPAGWEVDNIFCTAKPGDDVTTRADIDAGELTIAELSPGAEVTCTFVNEKQSAAGFCPASNSNVGLAMTDFIGRGMGSPSRAIKNLKLNVPNAGDVIALYGQLAADNVGFMKYVRFGYPNKTYVQIDAPTSPGYRPSAVSWWGGVLRPERFIKGQFFPGASAGKSPRAFVLWPTYRTNTPYADVFTVFDDSSTNHVYWNAALGWIPSQTQTIAIPTTQIDGADILVRVALVDNNKDVRPIVLTVSAGGVSKQIITSVPNMKDTLNLEEILLENVPAGTDEVVLTLFSPGPFDTTFGTGPEGGDSVAMIGAAASYACNVP